MDVATSLARVRERIVAACERAGRDPSGVRLLPVSKNMPTPRLREAYAAGVRRFGENRVQEASRKAEDLSDLDDLTWAVVGHLQSNKAKAVARFAAEFQALESLRLAAELDRRLQEWDRRLDVLIQVNSSAESSKFGLPPTKVIDFARELGRFPRLRVRGLMTLALPSTDPAPVVACFQLMRDLQAQLRAKDGIPGTFDELSMGMSNDFELAIEQGATVVRIGRAIFGERPPAP